MIIEAIGYFGMVLVTGEVVVYKELQHIISSI